MCNVRKILVVAMFIFINVQSETQKRLVEQRSFVNRGRGVHRVAEKDEKSTTPKEVIDTARSLADAIADTVVSLVDLGKKVTDVTFDKLEQNNKKELNLLQIRLHNCNEEMLEIQAKIDTLRI